MRKGQRVIARVDITTDILFGDGGDLVKVPSGTEGTILDVGDSVVEVFFDNGVRYTVTEESVPDSPIMTLDGVARI